MSKYRKEYQEIKKWFYKANNSNTGRQFLLMLAMFLYASIVRILVVIFVTEPNESKELSLFLYVSHIFLFFLICKICFGKWWSVEDKKNR